MSGIPLSGRVAVPPSRVPGGPGHLTIGRGHLITIADTLVPVAATEDGKAYLSPKAICDSLGISWQGQHEKIKADPVLASSIREIVMEVRRSDTGNMTARTMTMLPKEMVPGWLFTIKKVNPEVQAKLNRFRLGCFVALDTWFNKGLRRDVGPSSPAEIY